MDIGAILATITDMIPAPVMEAIQPIINKIVEFVSGLIGGGAA